MTIAIEAYLEHFGEELWTALRDLPDDHKQAVTDIVNKACCTLIDASYEEGRRRGKHDAGLKDDAYREGYQRALDDILPMVERSQFQLKLLIDRMKEGPAS